MFILIVSPKQHLNSRMKLIFSLITITLLLIIYSVIECDAKGGRGGGRSGGRSGSRGHSSSRGGYHSSSHGRSSTGHKTGHGGSSSVRNHFKNTFGSRRGGQGFWNSLTSVPFFSRFKLFGGKSKPHKSSTGKDINNNDISKTNNFGANTNKDYSKTNDFDSNGKTDISKANNYDDKSSSAGSGYSGSTYYHPNHHHTNSRRRQGHGSESTTSVSTAQLETTTVFTPLIETTTSITQFLDNLRKEWNISTLPSSKPTYEFPKYKDRFPVTDTMYPSFAEELKRMEALSIVPNIN